MTVYMKIYDNKVVFSNTPKTDCYEVLEHSLKEGVLYVHALKKNFQEVGDFFSADGSIVFDNKEQAQKFCDRLKVKDSSKIIKEFKSFFGKSKFYIEKQIVECEDLGVKDIAFKDFPIVDYSGILFDDPKAT